MKYCPQCGTAISTQALFCPSCGLEITLKNTSQDFQNKPLEKMQKGVTKSLQDKAEEYVENQAREKVNEITQSINQSTEKWSNDTEKSNSKFDERPIIEESNQPIQSHNQYHNGFMGNVSSWIWGYLLLSLVLGYFGHLNPEIQLVLLFSVFTLVMVFVQKDKPKPYNWVVKLLLLLQMGVLVIFEIRMYHIGLLNAVSILVFMLFFVNFIQLFKGNKN
jgi:uncharacterized Zn finger protein (UPF0148 family)